MKIILASSSEARKRLLKQIFPVFDVFPPEVDEKSVQNPVPSKRVKEIARLKALTVWKRLKPPNSLIISADSMVYQQGRFIGKPKNITHAKQILRDLSGSSHSLYTGFCLIKTDSMGNKKIVQGYDKTTIKFRMLTDREIEEFIRKFNVLTFAGGYTIEPCETGKGFVARMKGSKTNVVGLPLEKLKEEVKKQFSKKTIVAK